MKLDNTDVLLLGAIAAVVIFYFIMEIRYRRKRDSFMRSVDRLNRIR